MCLLIKSKSKPTPRIAKKPIKVWKVLDRISDNRFKSPYYEMIYERYNIYTSEIADPEIDIATQLWTIEEGLHSYTNKGRAIRMQMMHLSHYGFSDIIEMCIPEGAVYYRGENHEIVSDILIFP